MNDKSRKAFGKKGPTDKDEALSVNERSRYPSQAFKEQEGRRGCHGAPRRCAEDGVEQSSCAPNATRLPAGPCGERVQLYCTDASRLGTIAGWESAPRPVVQAPRTAPTRQDNG